MAENILPEVERRAKETGIISHIAETLVGKQSRKVAFGIWGFIAANTFLTTGKIDMVFYWKMFLTCALLIGFGTILDDILMKFGDKVATVAAKKVNTVVETTETTVTAPPAPPVQ